MQENGRATAAYVRVSSDKQDTARQEERIRATGLSVSFWFRDAEGKNPRDLPHKRPEFQRMLKAVEAGLLGKIIVDRQDRFGVADAYQWGEFINLLRRHDTVLADADGRTLSGDDDLSILSGTLGAITSTREQREKAHRNITGKQRKAKDGEYQGGYPPYGFDVVCFGADGEEKWRTVYTGQYQRIKVYPNGKRERFDGKDNSPRKDPTDKLLIRPSIEKERTDVAGRVFDWFATEDISPRQIATRLIELGIDAIYGRHWDKVRVREMLSNPAYIGFPTWNKKGASRFVEYVDGQFREVTNKKGGRKRAEGDFVQPAKPQYEPLVPRETWRVVQVKLQRSSEEYRSIPKRSPDTAALYLRPFVVCGHCGKPMHATTGRSTNYLRPSYFCSTYGRLGPRNPVGCHCHRVRHSVLEAIVKSYLRETSPRVTGLLDATETGNMEAAMPLVYDCVSVVHRETAAWEGISEFIEENAKPGEWRSLAKEGRSIKEIYGLIFERIRPDIEADMAAKEAALDQMLDDFRTLSPKLRDRANHRMESLQGEIEELRRRIEDLRVPWAALTAELSARKIALTNALQTLRKDGDGRQKTEALRAVLSEVRCWFRHTATKDAAHNGKSFLERVEIVPVAGSVYTAFTDGNRPGPS